MGGALEAGLVCWWKGSVRQAGGASFDGGKVLFAGLAGLSGGGRVPFASGSEALFVGGRVPFAHTLFIHGAALTANVSGALPAAPPTPPAPGQQNRRCAVPSPPFPRFRPVVMLHPVAHDLRPGLLGPSLGLAPSGPPQAAFKSAPGAFVHAGLTWLVNSRSAILMPDPPPTLNLLCFTERLLSL